MTLVVGGIPGIFGFLAWELKENWKLYRQNGSATVDPVAIGSHGERVTGLLRPGFHSGSIPKSFAQAPQCDAAEPDSHAAREPAPHPVGPRTLHGTGRRAVLGGRPALGPARPGSNRAPGHQPHVIRFMAALPEQRGMALNLRVEDRDGWLVATVTDTGWLPMVDENQKQAFLDVLGWALKLIGVAAFKPHTAWEAGCRPNRWKSRRTDWSSNGPSANRRR